MVITINQIIHFLTPKPDSMGSKILRNFRTYLQNCTASHASFFGKSLLQHFRSIISRNYCYHPSNALRVVHPFPYEYLTSPCRTSTWMTAGQISKAAWIPVLGVFRSIPDAESAHTDLWQKQKGPWQAMHRSIHSPEDSLCPWKGPLSYPLFLLGRTGLHFLPLPLGLNYRRQDSNFHAEINIWSWAPDGARHQDGLTDWPTVSCNVALTLTLNYRLPLNLPTQPGQFLFIHTSRTMLLRNVDATTHRIKILTCRLLWCIEPRSRYKEARTVPVCVLHAQAYAPFPPVCFSHNSNSLRFCMIPNKFHIKFTLESEDGGIRSLRKFNNDLPDYTASQPRLQQHP
jgi:hypothetical protein